MLWSKLGIRINGNYGGITCNSCGYSQSWNEKNSKCLSLFIKIGGIMACGAPFWVDRQIIKG